MKLHIDLNWTFNEVVDNLEALTTQYKGVIASFSYKQTCEETLYKRQVKQTIYSLNLKEWQIDKIWEVMNGYLDIEELRHIMLYTN